jgi:hypothetical protein
MPTVPEAIADARLPEAEDKVTAMAAYARALKHLGSKQAKWLRKFFTWAATIIIFTHILATLIAVVAMKIHGNTIAWLLGGELFLLALGFGTHQYLHRSRAVERWAMSRLAAEVARSVAAIDTFHVYLEFLFTLPFPPSLRHLLRTISVLHLSSTASTADEPWEAKRDAYVHNRLVRPRPRAQIPYNQDTSDDARLRLLWLQRIFFGSTTLAFIATLIKLLILCHTLPVSEHAGEVVTGIMGTMAILLPIVAVAALSLASAFDLEARYHLSAEMVEFLHAQRLRLENASTRREYARLLIETESRMLGETVNWYARRTFLGIA